MRWNVSAGRRVRAHFYRGAPKLSPVEFVVNGVMRGALTVLEPESRNGLAQIVCHGESEQKGTYWYMFFPFSGDKENQWEIRKLEDGETGKQIMLSSFIED